MTEMSLSFVIFDIDMI